MNIERMQQLKAAILAEPQSYEQDTWASAFNHIATLWAPNIGSLPRRALESQHISNGQLAPEDPLCGTACCMAGMVVAKNDPELYIRFLKTKHTNYRTSSDLIVARAKELLELTDSQASFLFASSECWPDELERRYIDAKDLQERAQVAADVIDYVINNADLLNSSAVGCFSEIEDDYDYCNDEEQLLELGAEMEHSEAAVHSLLFEDRFV